MISILYRGIRWLAGRTWSLLNPKAIAWRYIKKRHPNKPIIAKLGKDLKVRIYAHDVIGRSIYVNRMFEPAECKFIISFLKPGMLFLDVGANLGQYTLIAAQRTGEKGQVHSFEPSKRMFAELEFNVQINNLSATCTLNNVALSNNKGTAKLSRYQAGAEVYGSLGTQHRGRTPIIGYELVATTTIDTYLKEKGIDHVDLIKMDIEGAELLALQGGCRILSGSAAPAVLLEMADENTAGFGYRAIEIWDYLESLGYHVYRFNKHGQISNLTNRPEGLISDNFIALKSSSG